MYIHIYNIYIDLPSGCNDRPPSCCFLCTEKKNKMHKKQKAKSPHSNA